MTSPALIRHGLPSISPQCDRPLAYLVKRKTNTKLSLVSLKHRTPSPLRRSSSCSGPSNTFRARLPRSAIGFPAPDPRFGGSGMPCRRGSLQLLRIFASTFTFLRSRCAAPKEGPAPSCGTSRERVVRIFLNAPLHEQHSISQSLKSNSKLS